MSLPLCSAELGIYKTEAGENPPPFSSIKPPTRPTGNQGPPPKYGGLLLLLLSILELLLSSSPELLLVDLLEY